MASASPAQISVQTSPVSDLAAHLIERHYADLGCSTWNSRKVMLLCAKFGDTPRVMAARLRLLWTDFERRMVTDAWTKQDGLILTLLEQAVDFAKGHLAPGAGILPPP